MNRTEERTTAEVAAMYRVTASTVAGWCRKGLLTARKVARRWLIDLTTAIAEKATEVVAPVDPEPVPVAVVAEPERPSLWEGWLMRRRGW